MLKIISKWGAITGSAILVIMITGNYLLDASNPDNFGISEIFGYLTMFGCLCMIYVALNEAGQGNTIWQKIMIGLGVSVIAGMMFGVYNVIYTSYIDPEFMDNYYAYYIAQHPVQSGPEFDAFVAELEAQKEMFMHPVTQFFAMSATVIAVGIPLSVILAVLHKKLTGML